MFAVWNFTISWNYVHRDIKEIKDNSSVVHKKWTSQDYALDSEKISIHMRFNTFNIFCRVFIIQYLYWIVNYLRITAL